MGTREYVFSWPTELRRQLIERASTVRWVSALVVGASVPLIGFTPFNHASDVLGVESYPWRVVVFPATLLTALSIGAALVAPRVPSVRLPRWLVAGWSLLLIGALLSLIDSDDVTRTLLLIYLAIVLPGAFVVSLNRSRLSAEPMVLGFLVVTSVLLLRADFVFFADYGFPEPSELFFAKFANAPYDFHYYALQNPGQTAAFLFLPLTLSWFCVSRPGLSKAARLVALTAGVVCFATMILLYLRHAILIATVVVCVAILLTRINGSVRVAGVAATVAVSALAMFGTGDARRYAGAINDLSPANSSLGTNRSSGANSFSGANSSAGTEEPSASVRLRSMAEGFKEFARHPVTGTGFGRYSGPDGNLPAHSSLPQAAAEMGVLGLAGAAILTAGLIGAAFRRLRSGALGGVAAAATFAGAVFALDLAVAGGANVGLSNDYVTVWGMSAALVLTIALSEPQAGSGEPERIGVAGSMTSPQSLGGG